jgi:hypothetical protein
MLRACQLQVKHAVEKTLRLSGYVVWLRVNDGTEGEVDLGAELQGEVFQPLKDLKFFRSFQVHPELRTLVWPNGADFAPEFLRAAVKVAA